MVNVITGDLFKSEAQTLVNTVNCVGVMGKGVALEFKKRFSGMYDDYVLRCNRGEVRLGEPYLFERLAEPWILNFPTKQHWRSVSRLQDIVAGLEYLEQRYQEWGITSLAVPPLGCGNGGLDWQMVGPTLYRHFERFDIDVTLYAPTGPPEDQLSAEYLARPLKPARIGRGGAIEPSWVALASVVDRVSREQYHRPIGRIMFQKLAYFATEFGLPAGLQFGRGSYGPFSPGVKPLMTRLVNNGLVVEERIGNTLAVKPGPTLPDAMEAVAPNLERWEDIVERVTDLALRVTTRDLAGITATVHLVARELREKYETTPTEMDVLDEVKHWKQRRWSSLPEEDIAEAIRNLNVLGWVDVQPSDDLPVPDDDLLYA